MVMFFLGVLVALAGLGFFPTIKRWVLDLIAKFNLDGGK